MGRARCILIGNDPLSRARLEHWIRAATSPQRLVLRSRIVLLALAGVPADTIARCLGVSRPTVRLWIRRFQVGGPDALTHDSPGRGRHATIDAAEARQRLAAAGLLDADGRCTSLRRASQILGVSVTSVWRVMNRPAAQGHTGTLAPTERA